MPAILKEKLEKEKTVELREFYCEECDCVFWVVPNGPLEYCPRCGKSIWANDDIKIKKAK
jgi:uncharacterized paraquat-inducible protein A